MTKKKILYFFSLLLFSVFLFSSCKKSRSDIGAVLFKETRNKVFKQIDTTKYSQTFREVLKDMEPELRSPGLLKAWYAQNEYEPYFIVNFFPKEHLKDILNYYNKAPEHGLSPDLFDYSKLKPLVDKLYEKKGIRSVNEAYQTIAKVEILTANSLIKYSDAMQFGVVNPRRIFARYYMKVARPDSASMLKVFQVKDLKTYLDSVQPQDPAYKKLQQALIQGYQYKGLSKDETAKIIKLNLERLRWKTGQGQDKRYVWVNIPDFSVTFFENSKPRLTMKVVVGEAKEPNFYEKLKEYNAGDIDNRPFNHETPILSSAINTIVVNPVWNIPKSIVQNEIAGKAAEDPYYLSNNNINVYYQGKQIDPDNIDWGEVERQNIQFQFKQAPGKENALGKMKFLFPNSSSVYLHDTPAKSAFDRSVRDISHGCVRLENALALARAIVSSDKVYNQIESEFKGEDTVSHSFALKDKVPVYLDYKTCWVDSQGNIQIRPDIYYLDNILYRTMRKFLS